MAARLRDCKFAKIVQDLMNLNIGARFDQMRLTWTNLFADGRSILERCNNMATNIIKYCKIGSHVYAT